MITFILLAGGVILVVFVIILAYAANQRKRAGQAGEAVVESQTEQMVKPTVGRPTGLN